MTSKPMNRPGTLEAAVAELARSVSGPAQPEPVRAALERLPDALDRHCREAEEPGGMFDIIVSESPHLAHRIERLRGEHDQVRTDAGDLISALRREVASDRTSVPATLVARIGILAAEVDRHRRHAAGVVHEAFVAETGSSD